MKVDINVNETKFTLQKKALNKTKKLSTDESDEMLRYLMLNAVPITPASNIKQPTKTLAISYGD